MFTYRPISKQCWLKTTDEGRRFEGGSISGRKHCPSKGGYNILLKIVKVEVLDSIIFVVLSFQHFGANIVICRTAELRKRMLDRV